MTSVLGLDIGGANLKAAHSAGAAQLLPFPLWKQPKKLAAALLGMLQSLPDAGMVAVTMTGELCDCFETKRQGVGAILDAVEQVTQARPVRVWQTSGRFVAPSLARSEPLGTAAANWHALATFAGRFAPDGAAMLLDIGSTTTDIIPLKNGRPVPRGLTDTERLQARELVYTGVRRTPVCALEYPKVAAEWFATSLDVYLLLGDIEEDETTDTADGRPATKRCAHARLARMLCGDSETVDQAATERLARRAAAGQVHLIAESMAAVCRWLQSEPVTVILAGSGEFLGRRVVQRTVEYVKDVVSLSDRLGPRLSEAACAYAVAMLASEETLDVS